ncbi:PASTA domain-containing protein [Clostridium minihomine]|uniref:PASTA domain-containing protein n=1 Tax=Clostridium minihomine TaxID=2045012 RepID=UPI000C780C23|nr:PASTA domain-containing protein [Clostridium minihomine]
MTDFELCMNCMSEKAVQESCPHCGHSEDEPQEPEALPLKTMLQNRYLIGLAQKTNGEGISYIGYDSVLNIKTLIREFFPQTMSERLPEGLEIRIVDGSEITFEEYKASFLSHARELAHVRQLSAIEQIYDIFEENGTAYTVAEWEDCITLRYFVERSGGSLDWNAARPLFMPVLSALSTLHSKGINHLGISPDTLVILQDGKMKLTDFQLDAVRRMDTDLPPDLVAGCAALEQYVMDYVPDEATDVYGFAACLFFALTGTLPQDALRRKADSRLMIPTNVLRALPPYVITGLANALQVMPSKRTPHFERMRAELSSAPTVTAKIGDTMSPILPEPEPVRKGTPGIVWAIGSGVVSLAIFILIGIFWLFPPGSGGVKGADLPAVSAGLESTATGIMMEAMPDSNAGDANRIETPNLVGKKLDDILAEKNSGESNYEILVSDKEFSDTVAENLVIRQAPEPGQRMEKGTKIVVVVSQGSHMRSLPEIRGLSLADASLAVTTAGLTPAKRDVFDDDVPAGEAVGYQDQQAGDTLEYGSHVVILLSKGPDPSVLGNSTQ